MDDRLTKQTDMSTLHTATVLTHFADTALRGHFMAEAAVPLHARIRCIAHSCAEYAIPPHIAPGVGRLGPSLYSSTFSGADQGYSATGCRKLTYFGAAGRGLASGTP